MRNPHEVRYIEIGSPVFTGAKDDTLLRIGFVLALGLICLAAFLASHPAEAKVKEAKFCMTNAECCKFLDEYQNGSDPAIANPCEGI